MSDREIFRAIEPVACVKCREGPDELRCVLGKDREAFFKKTVCELRCGPCSWPISGPCDLSLGKAMQCDQKLRRVGKDIRLTRNVECSEPFGRQRHPINEAIASKATIGINMIIGR